MAAKKEPQDPNEIVHLQVSPGKTVRYMNLIYGDRATLQVERRNLDRVEGEYEVVAPDQVPDVADSSRLRGPRFAEVRQKENLPPLPTPAAAPPAMNGKARISEPV